MASVIDSVAAADASGAVTTLESGTLSANTGTDRVIYALVSSSAGAAANVTAVKFASAAGVGGESLTLISAQEDHHVNGRMSLWRLIGPSATSGTIWAQWAAGQDERIITAVSISGADQTTPNRTLKTALGTDGTASATAILAVSGDLTIDFVVFTDTVGASTGVTPTTGQTQLEDHATTPTAFDRHGLGSKTATSSSETRTWTNDGSTSNEDWGMFAFAVIDAAGGGAATTDHARHGDRRNRPGRGPYSLGRFFRQRVDAYIVQSFTLVVADATHSHAADSPTLTQASALTVADALHSHAAESPSLTQAHLLVVSATRHLHAVDSPTLTQANTLSVADALHEHTSDAVALVQANLLAVQDALHGHAADSLTLTSGLSLAIADALHAHAADNVALVQAHILTVADTRHTHSVENVTLSEGLLLAVADALHAHSTDSPSLTQAHVLAVASALHLHVSDAITLTQASMLVVSDSLHAHLADALSLRLPGDEVARHLFVIKQEQQLFLIAREPNVFKVH